MEKETKTVEVQVYLNNIWRKPSEKPSNKGYGDNVIPVIYFGTQFLELWTEYLAYNFRVGERLK